MTIANTPITVQLAAGDIVIQGEVAKKFLSAFYDVCNANESLIVSASLFQDSHAKGVLQAIPTVGAFCGAMRSDLGAMLEIIEDEAEPQSATPAKGKKS